MVPRQVAGLTRAAVVFVCAALAAGSVVFADDSCEALWQRTRELCVAGEHVAADERAAAYERAVAAGTEAVRQCPDSVDAHYWLGASYGRAAEAKGGVSALGLARRLRREMTFVVQHQPGYEGGDAFLALGELDLSLPRLLGGDRTRGLSWLRRGLQVAPENAEIRLALARALLDGGNREEAAALLRGLREGSAPGTPSPEVRREAEDLLQQLQRRAHGAPGQ